MTDAAASTILNSNVQVGGRNRLANTENPTDSESVRGVGCNNGTISGGSLTYSNGVGTYTVNSTANLERYVRFIPPNSEDNLANMGLPSKGDLVLSGYVKVATSGNGRCRLHIRGQFATTSKSWTNPAFTNLLTGEYVPSAGSVNIAVGAKSEWTPFAVKISWSSDEANKFYLSLQMYNETSTNTLDDSLKAGDTFQFKKLKLEKGNKATDWTPAPEDQTEYVDSSVYQSAQPNLSPFFSISKDDVYNASTNPTGYWKRITTQAQFTTYEMQVEHNGSEGWAHFAGNATSGNPFVRFEPVYKALKPSTTYTFLAEVEGTFNNSSNVNLAFYSGTNQSDAIDPFSTNLTVNVKGGGAFYRTGKTRADLSTSAVLNRGYVQVYGTGTFDFYIRISLYEGEYSGPYKPYSGDQLYATNSALAGTNESLEGAITDIGELSDQLVDTTTEQNKTITTIQTYLNSLRQDLDAEIESRQKWLNFDTAEGLIIGAKNSTFKTVTTNTSQQFKNGGTVLAETSGMEFVAPIMRSDQILIGNWMWTRRDNGNLSLKWIG